MSYKVVTDKSGAWSDDDARFATRIEAECHARFLADRSPVSETRIVESSDPVNSRWDVDTGLLDAS